VSTPREQPEGQKDRFSVGSRALTGVKRSAKKAVDAKEIDRIFHFKFNGIKYQARRRRARIPPRALLVQSAKEIALSIVRSPPGVLSMLILCVLPANGQQWRAKALSLPFMMIVFFVIFSPNKMATSEIEEEGDFLPSFLAAHLPVAAIDPSRSFGGA